MKQSKVREINPVAKYANKFNRAQTMRDRKNDYQRREKFRDERLSHFN